VDDSVDRELAVDVRETIVPDLLDADFGRDKGRVDLQEDDVSAAAVKEVLDALHLFREGAVDEALLLQGSTESRLSVRAISEGLLPMLSEGEVVDPVRL
jgi:hypothetical protein